MTLCLICIQSVQQHLASARETYTACAGGTGECHLPANSSSLLMTSHLEIFQSRSSLQFRQNWGRLEDLSHLRKTVEAIDVGARHQCTTFSDACPPSQDIRPHQAGNWCKESHSLPRRIALCGCDSSGKLWKLVVLHSYHHWRFLRSTAFFCSVFDLETHLHQLPFPLSGVEGRGSDTRIRTSREDG